MFKMIKDKYRELLTSLLKSLENSEAALPTPENNAGNHTGSENADSSKIWKKELQPLRQIILWGWDGEGNPAFLILYGRQNHQVMQERETNNTCYILDDAVKYKSYAVFKGRAGHLPSFAAVKIVDESLGYYSNKDAEPEMYYKKGVKGWHKDRDYLVEGYQNLSEEEQITFPYFKALSHTQYVQKIEEQNLCFPGFTLAKHPSEILKLDGKFAGYTELIAEMMSYPNLYIRKKRLNELLAKEPAKELFARLLEIGSTELVSGLFLELAKRGLPVLLPEAREMMDAELPWASGNYAKGVKRCAGLYLNALNPEAKDTRIKWIHKHLNNMDLRLTRLNERDIPEDQVIAGSTYRSYANSGLLKDYYERYDYKQREYIQTEAPTRYHAGPYTDGVKLKIIDFKSTIQEAEIYGLADVIGKIAYYLDAPRLTYYFKGSGKTKAWSYFQRYLRRIIDGYAQNNPDHFMTAMKHLLTSYTPADYVCKFRDNFQFNIFLKHYLYYQFNENAPTGWYEHYEWVSNDQLMRLQGRYEMRPEIWDNHLDVVADIACRASVAPVLKACYYILKDSPNSNQFMATVNYSRLIGLALVSYPPLAEMFSAIFRSKMNQLSVFDPELMLALINCPDEKMHQLAMEFFQRTNGAFSAVTIADLLLLDEPGRWVELFRQNLLALKPDQYGEFIKHILDRDQPFLGTEHELPENITDVLIQSVDRVKQLAAPEKLELLSEMMRLLHQKAKLPDWVEALLENLIFALDDELEALMSQITVKPASGPVAARNKRILGILEALQNGQAPQDSQIIGVLEHGSSKMFNVLLRILAKNVEALKERYSTLLIMLESNVAALNHQAEMLFDSLPPEQQQKLLRLIIDSPVPRAYSLGLRKLDAIYGEQVPEEFIVQMLEHGSAEVKAYISDKVNRILGDLGTGNQKLFMYYARTLLLLPNRISKSKDRVYTVLPGFALKYQEQAKEIESMLLDIGGSNIRLDAERALVALGKIRREVMQLEG